MGFIKPLWVWLLVVALLSACTTAPTSNPDQTRKDFKPLPDPYLVQEKPLPAQARADFRQAVNAMNRQKWQEAEKILRRMTQAYPSLSGPHVNLGLVYRQMNKDSAAIESFKRATEINPLNSEAYNQLGILYREHGQFSQAEQSYLQALEVWPHNPVVHRNLGILYDLYMGRFDDALRHYQLSQKVSEEPEQRVAGWIVDLQRRMTEKQAAVR